MRFEDFGEKPFVISSWLGSGMWLFAKIKNKKKGFCFFVFVKESIKHLLVFCFTSKVVEGLNLKSLLC